MRKNRLIALIGTLTMAAAGLAAVSAGVLSKKAEGVSAVSILPSSGKKYAYLECSGDASGFCKDCDVVVWTGTSDVTADIVDIYYDSSSTYKAARIEVSSDFTDTLYWKRCKQGDHGTKWNEVSSSLSSSNHSKVIGSDYSGIQVSMEIAYFDKGESAHGDVTLTYKNTDFFEKQFEGNIGEEYGDQIVLTATPDVGYHLVGINLDGVQKITSSPYGFHSGWTITDKFGKHGTITATFAPDTDTAYKVKHYKEDLTGGTYTLAETENKTGTTGQNTNAAAKTYEGFTGPASITQVPIAGDGTTVVEIRYTRNSHNLSWDPNGGTLSGSYTSGTVKYGTTIVTPTATKTGHHLEGWNGTVPGTMPDNDLAFTAQWSPDTYTINYLPGTHGVGEPQQGTKKYGVDLTLPNAQFTRENYIQKGWATEDLGEKVYELGGTYSGNTGANLYPYWEEITKPTYNVDIVANNPDFGSINPYQVDAVEDDEVSYDGNVLHIGGVDVTAYPSNQTEYKTYKFTGWSNVPSTITSPTTITANFAEEDRLYTLGWNYGGTGDVVEKTPGTSAGSYTYNTDVTAPVLEREGFSFNGWEPEFSNKLTQSVTYEAKWKAITPGVRVVADDTGYGAVSPSGDIARYAYNSTIVADENLLKVNGTTISTATPKAAGPEGTYSFVRWDGIPASGKLTEDVQITAIFDKEDAYYDLAWDFAGGSTTDTEYTPNGNYIYNTDIVAPTNASMSKKGYNFTGWNPAVASKLTSDQTYTAQWELKQGYYIVGLNGDWTLKGENYLEDYENDQKHIVVSMTEGTNFKIVNHYYKDNVEHNDYYGWNWVDGSSGSARSFGQLDYDKNSQDTDRNIVAKVDGTFEIFFKYTWDENKIWIPAVSETYTLNVSHNGVDTSYAMEFKEGNEYMTSHDVTVYSGDVISVFKGTSENPETMVAKSVGNNNCWNNNGVTTVCLNMTHKIYVDVVNKTIFCGGLEINKFGMVVNDNYVELKHNETPVDPSFNEWYSETAYEFEEGDVIKFVDTTLTNANAIVFHVGKINEDSLTDKFEVQSDNTILALDDIETMVYLKLKSGEDEVFFGNQNYINALAFAKDFNSKLGAICESSQSSEEKQALINEWKNQAQNFAEMTDTSAKNILKTVTLSSAYPTLKEFAEKYDYIYSKYKVELSPDITDFADRFGENGGGQLIFKSNALFSVDNVSSSTWIIVSVVIVGIAAAGVFFIYRKRKEN